MDEAVAQSGLNVTLRDTLKKFPGCVHWHLKSGREPGTLEITLWPEQHRAWFTVQKNRSAPWIQVEMARLEASFQRLFNTRPGTISASTNSQAKEVVLKFWQAMQTNDFRAVAELLAEDYELFWPQSGERIVGRANFILVNEHYPANGPWRFSVDKILADGNEVVTDVGVTDGVVAGRALTFSTVENGLIVKQVEYWPDPFKAPAWRRGWVERGRA